jgi:membrane associated rhomboid family serine protease
MIIVPIRHENMQSRRWPVVTLALIAINILVFLLTMQSMDNAATQAPQSTEVRLHIRLLAAMHPELQMSPEAQAMVEKFRQDEPKAWKYAQDGNREVQDAWDARMRMIESPAAFQAEMDSLCAQYAQNKQAESASFLDQYGFVTAHPKPISYVTANFLHAGWLHLIGNMWFLWLAGFVLEDRWGRVIYAIFYLVAGAAALQLYAWIGGAHVVIGASGAIAALMGAFMVRFGKMKLDMLWLVRLNPVRFQAEAYWMLPLWLLAEFWGTIFGQGDGVAHWAHIGGFVFGVVIALAIQHSGLEHKASAAIEEKITLKGDPEIEEATELIHQNQTQAAIELLKNILAKKPDSLDACALLQQTYWRIQDLPAYYESTIALCGLHLKAREPEQAWQLYEEFLNSGGKQVPAAAWLDLCRAAETLKYYQPAADEYQKLAAAYPREKAGLVAQISAARICLKQLNRPNDALRLFEAASASPVPHLDWEQTIAAGIREARAAGTAAHA